MTIVQKNWKLFKKSEIIKIQTIKGTLALDGERRLEFSDKNKANIRINILYCYWSCSVMKYLFIHPIVNTDERVLCLLILISVFINNI